MRKIMPPRPHRTASERFFQAGGTQTPAERAEARRAAAMDLLLSVAIGTIGAACLVYWWTCSVC